MNDALWDRIGSTHLAPKSHLVTGKEVGFFEMEWPGFEPRTFSLLSLNSQTKYLFLPFELESGHSTG